MRKQTLKHFPFVLIVHKSALQRKCPSPARSAKIKASPYQRAQGSLLPIVIIPACAGHQDTPVGAQGHTCDHPDQEPRCCLLMCETEFPSNLDSTCKVHYSSLFGVNFFFNHYLCVCMHARVSCCCEHQTHRPLFASGWGIAIKASRQAPLSGAISPARCT